MRENKSKIKKTFKWMALLSMAGMVTVFVSIWLCNSMIQKNAHGKMFNNPDELQSAKVALVLGASAKTRRGWPNQFFVKRIKAAAELYHSGKVKYLIVSGDNSRKEYDEPTDMKQALMKLGVPASRIYMDYAGFRTWDSVIRCMKIFGQKDFIVVSQPFHNERAIYIAEHFGCKVQAYNAGNVNSMKNGPREKLARVKLFADMLVGKKPKFLGKSIVIGQPQTDINA